jgi:Zn ribbon nucleic-acid-binding protein
MQIANSNIDIISNCPLCEEHSLHIAGEDNSKIQQCISCGYVTTIKFSLNDGKSEDNESYNELSDEMKSWSKEANGRIWIPSFMTLPVAILFPLNDGGKMKWAHAPMVSIPEDEQKDYPNGSGGFYDKRYDTDSAKIHDEFWTALYEINEIIKKKQSLDSEIEKEAENLTMDMKLPKLKKV